MAYARHMQRERIIHLRDESRIGERVQVAGWVRTFRNETFIALNDGSCLGNLQLVIDREATPEADRKRLTTGAAIRALGTLERSQGSGQLTELRVEELEILHHSKCRQLKIIHLTTRVMMKK